MEIRLQDLGRETLPHENCLRLPVPAHGGGYARVRLRVNGQRVRRVLCDRACKSIWRHEGAKRCMGVNNVCAGIRRYTDYAGSRGCAGRYLEHLGAVCRMPCGHNVQRLPGAIQAQAVGGALGSLASQGLRGGCPIVVRVWGGLLWALCPSGAARKSGCAHRKARGGELVRFLAVAPCRVMSRDSADPRRLSSRSSTNRRSYVTHGALCSTNTCGIAHVSWHLSRWS